MKRVLSAETKAKMSAAKSGKKRPNMTGPNHPMYRHGLTHTPTWTSWRSMLTRCLNQRDPNYQKYGAKGIKVCAEWTFFDNFLADMGIRPEGKTLDRIDSKGNYELGNCRWATLSEQNRNRTFSRKDPL